MKKILIICEKLAQERTGGIQTRVINYLENLPKLNISPDILSIASYDNFQKENIDESIIFRYPKSNKKDLISFIRQNTNKYQIFHFLEGINGSTHMMLFLLLWMYRKKPIVSLYGGEMYDAIEDGNYIKKVKLYLIQKLSYRLIVNSQATKDFLPKRYHKKVFIVNPGVNSKYLSYIDKFEKNTNDFTLFFAGRLIRRKGLDDIMQALKIAQAKIPEMKLNVAGDGPNLENLKAQAKKLDILEKVNFLGDIKDIEKMARLYSECDIFLMTPKLVSNPPGGYESFGCVYLEANLFGKPVIGTKHFGVQEAIADGDTGILVDENNPEQIANTIIKLHQDQDLARKLGGNGQRRTREEYMDINSTIQLKKAYL